MKSRVFVPDDSGIELAVTLKRQFQGKFMRIVAPMSEINEAKPTDIVNTGPHCTEHYFDTVSANTRLNAVPNAVQGKN